MKTIINTNFGKILAIAIISMVTFSAAAQEEETTPKFSFSGTVDAYYRANITAPNDEEAIAPGSSFAQLPGFSLGMANVIAAYEGEKVGFVADLVFGPRGTDAIFASPMYSATGDIVNQLYVYWNVSDAVTLTFGNFNTFLGYEVISPAANFNYSTSYLFSYGPFSHTGLKADFDLGNDWSAMVAVMNPTDLTEFNPTGDYAVGAQLGYSGQFLNFLYSQGGFEIDYTGGFDLSDEFFLGINAAHFSMEDDGGSFTGAALYPQYAVSETFSLGLRGEYFMTGDFFGDTASIGSDPDGDGSVLALTLTGSATIGNLILKPEIRLDSSAEDAFIDHDLAPTSSLASVLFAAIYSF
ncbi:outer membrane beta-barrel protein [Flagellimonas halotolerans]|uniref:Outer membrane beta-barrel protein n=1 Tax=Flagellimonas halotolerans TaxID=3112164 RepID=A0ABU6IPK0_9FLAO|nr:MULTISPECIES: outer membrane beta-barrel protein [unclassified Allomuricauda]MEC3965107.1 outer membrane beta-barrel protein [Muricauda sp. SYSU M86414]MEC4265048.1 outer membrane beta-barrel protein [Muricauda sp. SYSU M84420]